MYLPRSLISHLYTQLVRSYHPLSSPVLILSSLDPDAICACRIFAALLKRDYIPHKIQPVAGYEDLAKAGDTLVRPMKTTEGGSGGVVICLGVGGLIDLSSMLGLDSDDPAESMAGVEVWLLDARRPWNLHNVFGGQPPSQVLQETDANARRKTPGVDKGCLQRSYKPGKGGVIVFDDGDINDELNAERDAYAALADMPDFDEEVDDDDDQDDADDVVENSQDSNSSKKRKSWSDRDEDDSVDGDDERPTQRRRSNSGSSIASPNRSPPSSQPSSPPPMPKQPTAKQLRRKLINLKKSHEAVLDKYYSIGNSYSEPISSIAYSLASELGREDNDMLWLAIVGVTSLELSGYTSTGLGTSRPKAQLPNNYHKSWKATRSSRIYGLFRDEVRRLNPPKLDENNLPRNGEGPTSPSDDSIRMTPDPRFLLLRHWSLYDSMLHSPYLASRLHVWKDDGIKRLHKLLAKMGVSLSQCKQTYTHMDMDLKKVLRERLLQYAGVYGLDDIVPSGHGYATYEQEGWGFLRTWGWKAQLSAIDVGVILGAILDVGVAGHHFTSSIARLNMPGSSQSTSVPEDVADRSEVLIPRFFAAYDALAPSHPTQLLSAIPTAQHLLRAINRTGSSLLSKRQLRHLRAFRMSVLKEGPDLALFANSPGALTKLALWLSESIEVSERDRKGIDEATPFVLAALDEARGTYLIVGTGGGIGAAADHEAKKEKDAARQKRKAEKEEERAKKRQDREKRKEIRRAALGEDEEDEETESESEAESSEDESDDEGAGDEPKERGFGHNRFGIAFQEVVEETSARVKIDSFDHCVVEVQKEDLTGFLEGLSLKSVLGK